MKLKYLKGYSLRVSSVGEQYQGYIKEVLNLTQALEDYVGGEVEAIPILNGLVAIVNKGGHFRGMYSFSLLNPTPEEEKQVVLFHVDGKGLDFPINRIWVSEDDEEADVLCGDIFVVRCVGNLLTSILEEDIPKIEEVLPVCIHECSYERLAINPNSQLLKHKEDKGDGVSN